MNKNKWKTALPKDSHDTWFLLIQRGAVLDVSRDPTKLLWSVLEAKQNFQVYLGVLNEFNTYEVIGPCGEYIHGNNSNWHLTSRADGYNRLVGITGTPADCLSQRLGVLFNHGRFSNPVNFETVILQG